jgi:hypothetical protein|tara:strand:+ start:681 stop:905 length:225 start_codon:yes stop_codon:yes gene_type:complete
MLERGTQVIGVWGAMVSESHGYVCSMENTNQGTEVDIMWDNGSVHHTMLSDIRDDYIKNNQIGLYVNPFTEELM